jgi:type I restriction enzyme S subunit
MNYKTLGDYIVPVKVKNIDLKATELLGINIDKFFMPSVANVVGTDLSSYKVVEKNQFACNRMHVGRDYRIPVALSDRDEPFMVSPAYDVFQIKDTTKLLPEYLMMWFSRAEFDRNAWFYTDADVRGGLAWDAFCNMKLPVPNIEKQREIVAEYNTIKNRMALNNQLIQKLEETAQAIYKQWFVEFEFPDENGKPYKSNGGKMVWNEELEKEIPEGWEVGKLGDIAEIKHGNAFSGENFSEIETDLVLVSPGNFKIKGGFNFRKNKYFNGDFPPTYVLTENELIVNMTDLSKNGDTLGNTAIIPNIQFKTLLHNQRVGKFIFYDNLFVYLVFLLTNQSDYKNFILGTATGTTVRHTSPSRIEKFPILNPSIDVLSCFNKKVKFLINNINNSFSNEYYLNELKSLLLAKMTKVETKKEIV